MNLRELTEAVISITNTPALNDKIRNLIILARNSLKASNTFTDDVDVKEFNAIPTYDIEAGVYSSYIPVRYYEESSKVLKVELFTTSCQLTEVSCYSPLNILNFTKGYSSRGVELRSKAEFNRVKLYSKVSESADIPEDDWLLNSYSAYFIHYAAYFVMLEYGQTSEAAAHYAEFNRIKASMKKDIFS